MRPPRPTALLGAVLAALACDGRDVTVFDLADTGGVVGVAGSTAGGIAGAGAAVSPPASGSGGLMAGGGGAGGVTDVGMAGDAGIPSLSCGDSRDCSPGWLCDKDGCEAASGVCVPWPVICPPEASPVCGCDGITYWNDCVRLQSRAQLAGTDQCRATTCPCEVGSDCNVPYASCSHLIAPGEMCGRGVGSCWVLPQQCPPGSDSKMWRECKPPDSEPAGACVDTCSAIASERSFAQLRRGENCN